MFVSRKMQYVLLLVAVFSLSLCSSLSGAEEPPKEDESPVVSGENGDDLTFVRDGELDLDAAVDHFEDLYRATSSVATAELVITTPRQTRKLRMKAWSKGDEKALITIEAPAREKGTSTLKVDDNLWNYLPKIKRTIRIPPSMMLSSWMGSDFTNDDLVREASFREDYGYELTGPSEDPPGWVITFEAKPDVVGLWNRMTLVLNEKGTIPIKAEYFDRKDRLARVMSWSELKVFDGRLIPSRMQLLPKDKEGHLTELVYLDLDFDVDHPESMFSLSRLEQSR